MDDYTDRAAKKSLMSSVPTPRPDPRDLKHPEDAPEGLKGSVDALHSQLESIPVPAPDPRGYDSGSMMRNFGKYPASFPEKAAALAGAI